MQLVPFFEVLLHEAAHVSSLGLATALDPQLVVVAREYDVSITSDLHRQEPEWLAVHWEIVNAGVKVLRIRLPKREPGENLRLVVMRLLLNKMERWLEAFSGDAALITLGPSVNRLSVRTAPEVQDLLRARMTRLQGAQGNS